MAKSKKTKSPQNVHVDTFKLKSDQANVHELSSNDPTHLAPSSSKASQQQPPPKQRQHQYQQDSSQAANAVPSGSSVEWARLASCERFEEDNRRHDPVVLNESHPVDPTLSTNQLMPISSRGLTAIHPWQGISNDSLPSIHNKTPTRMSQAADIVKQSDSITQPPETPPPKYTARNYTDPDLIAPNKVKGSQSEVLKDAMKRWNDNKTKEPGIQLKAYNQMATGETPNRKLKVAARTVQASVRFSRMAKAKRRAKWAGKVNQYNLSISVCRPLLATLS